MAPLKILIINPNTTKSMTDGLREPVESLDYNNTEYTYLTAPTGIPSINSEDDGAISAEACLLVLLPHLPHHDAFLVACFSPHPLVPILKQHTSKPVLGIFEAAVYSALQLLGTHERFGIVSTGDVWKQILGDAIRLVLLGEDKARECYAGTETCGLNAGELHGHEEVERRVKDAARRLVRGAEQDEKSRVGAVILGCAGMVGMEKWVRDVVPKDVKIVDGVKAGVGVLQGLVRCRF